MQMDHLQAKSPEENHDANMEEMGDAKGKAEEYAYHSGPLSVNTEIPRREFLCDSHLCSWRCNSEVEQVCSLLA